VCQRRDPKGLYYKEKLGKIRGMTGVSSPYEEPDHPDMIISSDKYTIEESVEKILKFLIDYRLIKIKN